jgi:hypothetical protein
LGLLKGVGTSRKNRMENQELDKIRQLEPNLILAPTKLNFYTSVLSPADRS